MKQVMLLMAGISMAGCGADGEPVQPAAQTVVSISSRGVAVATGIGLAQGPVTFSLGMGL